MISKKSKPAISDLKYQIDHSALGTIIITKPDSSIVYANGAIEEKTGFSPGEAIGKKPSQLWGGAMDKPFYHNLWHTIATQKQPFVGLIKNHKKNGMAYQELLHIAPIVDTGGTIKFFIEINPTDRASDRKIKNFTNRFVHIFREQWANKKTTVDFFLHLFSLPTDKDTGSLEEFLQKILVDPTQETYSNRLEDKELITLAQLDNSHFDTLYQKYFLKIKQYFYKRADPTFAEDLTQETFLQAFKHLPRFTISNASYLTYLLRIAHTVLANHYRLTAHQPITQDMELMQQEPATAVDEATWWDVEKLWKAVHAMPHIEQQVLVLKYREDRLVKDIAQKVGKSENAVKLILSRSRKKLRQALLAF